MKEITEYRRTTRTLFDLIEYEYDTYNILGWTLTRYLMTDNAVLAKLGEDNAYMNMHKQYK